MDPLASIILHQALIEDYSLNVGLRYVKNPFISTFDSSQQAKNTPTAVFPQLFDFDISTFLTVPIDAGWTFFLPSCLCSVYSWLPVKYSAQNPFKNPMGFCFNKLTVRHTHDLFVALF